MEQDAIKMEKNFTSIEQLYEEALEELTVYKKAIGYGATFQYVNHDDTFIPLFVIADSLDIDGEAPHQFTLNFNEKNMAEWITSCNKLINPESEDE
jgi:hypothetical protein